MKLKLRRSQKSGMTGTVTFSMHAIVDLNADEEAALKKYKFGKTTVYESPKGAAASGLLRAGGGLHRRARGNFNRGPSTGGGNWRTKAWWYSLRFKEAKRIKFRMC